MSTSKRSADAGSPAGDTTPGGEQELREDIEQTRERLGETVERLAAKADVKRQARAKAAKLAERVNTAAAPVWNAAPEPVRRAVTKGASTARQRRAPLAAALVALIVCYATIRRWRKP